MIVSSLRFRHDHAQHTRHDRERHGRIADILPVQLERCRAGHAACQGLRLEIFHIAKINVRATPAAKTDGAETRPFVTPKGSPKDKNLIAATGTEYVAYINGDQTVRVRK